MSSNPQGATEATAPVAQDQRPPAITPADIWEVEPVIRRVISARVTDRSVVDDLVQDALERLLSARGRMDPAMLVAYGVVTARNVAIDHGRRTARRAALRHQLVDLSVPEQPDEVVVRSEEQAAMAAALSRLPAPDRVALIAHDLEGVPIVDLTPEEVPAATTRVRLSRSRARLRVEYVLALRNVELVSPQCRPTLLALAGGDKARQQSWAPSQHLLRCGTCASLSEPLMQRHRGMMAVLPLALAWRALAQALKGHQVAVATAGIVAAAGVAGAVAVTSTTTSRPPRPAPAPVVSAPPASDPPPTAAPAPPAPDLTIGGRPLSGGGSSLAAQVGQPVVAAGAPVVAVVTHNGFWVGDDGTNRLWVELTGPLRPLRVHVGDRVSFSALLVAQAADYPVTAGVSPAGGAGQLAVQGAHVAVATTGLAFRS